MDLHKLLYKSYLRSKFRKILYADYSFAKNDRYKYVLTFYSSFDQVNLLSLNAFLQ